jgi:quinolinate synthase
VKTQRPPKVLLLTECSMSDNVAAELPEIEFVRPCNLCPHMKRITLPKIRHSLENMSQEILIDPALIDPARRAVERMLEIR